MEDRHLCKARPIGTRKQWVTGFYAVLGEKTVIIVNEPEKFYDVDSGKNSHGNKIVEVIPKTICRCTGLEDKNGKLIWENDIVNGSIKRGVAFYRCLVLWNECKARFDVRALGCNFPMTLDECTDDISMSGFDYEVVGNRFDNPELLEV
nr:MAG TPA: YopX protein [Caudoviricetes sp.]